jgi:predicted DNA repair protein MutK
VPTGLLALLDDITSILDDVSAMTKVAAGKTVGVLGDDLALNAQQVAEVRADRELPVVWAVAKGSALNKAILVPAALAISAFAPWLVMPLLMLGGAYLCFEGVEKLAHPWLHEAASGPHAPPRLRTSGQRCVRQSARISSYRPRSSSSRSARSPAGRWRHRSA